MRSVLILAMLFVVGANSASAAAPLAKGNASWYGEDHRGRRMANGKKFNPDKFTAASWFYPLGTKVRVTLDSARHHRSVMVTITDRGPAKDLVREGRIIDLSHAPFERLASPDLGIVSVKIQPLQ